MPGFDRTGPLGQGPMTGGGFGRCGSGRRFANDIGADSPVNVSGRGRGFGFGRGGGRGRRRAFAAGYGRLAGSSVAGSDAGPETDVAELQRQIQDLKAYIRDVEARIAEAKARS